MVLYSPNLYALDNNPWACPGVVAFVRFHLVGASSVASVAHRKSPRAAAFVPRRPPRGSRLLRVARPLFGSSRRLESLYAEFPTPPPVAGAVADLHPSALLSFLVWFTFLVLVSLWLLLSLLVLNLAEVYVEDFRRRHDNTFVIDSLPKQPHLSPSHPS